MAQHYSNPKRANDPYSLPDLETFYMTASDFINADENTWMHERMTDDLDSDADSLAGWYYWFCFPDYLPDSDPIGPFDTEAAALVDAQE